MRVRITRLKLVQLAISGALLTYLFSIIPFADLARAATRIDPVWVAAGLAVALVVEFLSSLQMLWIIAPQRTSISAVRIFLINLITTFYSLLLPGAIAGGVVRWYQFTRAGVSAEAALASIVVNRLVEILIIATTGMLFLIADLRHEAGRAEVALMSGSVLLLLLAYIAMGTPWVVEALRRIVGRMPLRPSWQDRLGSALDALGVYSALGVGFHLRVFSVAISRQLVGSLSLYCFALALGIDISFATITWVRCLFALLSQLPISISGWGLREATFVGAFALYGVAPESALLLSLLWFGRTLFIACIGGLVEAERVFLQPRRQALP